jgi:hypothetical protein
MIRIALDGDPAASLRRQADALITAAADGVAEAAAQLETELRSQVVAAGLGSRLAGSWQGRVYPAANGTVAGEVTTSAPLILTAFTEGATILARHGRWLAIPTAEVPQGQKRRFLTPAEVEARAGRPLRFIQPPGHRTAFLVLDPPPRSRNARPQLLFILVPQVTLRKRLDLAGALARAEAALPDLLEHHLTAED